MSWQKEHSEQHNKRLREWRAKQGEKYRQQANAYIREWRARRKQEQMIEPTTQLSLMPEIVEEKVRLIDDKVVQREERQFRITRAVKEGVVPPDWKPLAVTGHVCHFYAPYGRCICGKRQGEAVRG